MKIVSWNCRGGFRNKFKYLLDQDVDIYIIQECENPVLTQDSDYRKFASNYIWIGDNMKGLEVFAKDTIKLKNNEWKTYGIEWCISCNINNQIDLIAVWTCGNYIEDFYTYLQIYYDRLEKLNKVIIGGDFNSNAQWDKQHKRRSHSSVVKQLQELGIYSYYHIQRNENQGNEKIPTFYLYKKQEMPYHIDYFFGRTEYFRSLKIGHYDDWIKHSDHMPIEIEIE